MRYCGRHVVFVGLQSEKHFRTINVQWIGQWGLLAVVAFHRINNLRVVNIVISSTPAKRVDQSDRVWVDEANAVPKDIPFTSSALCPIPKSGIVCIPQTPSPS